jgi:hypothetical protein
VSVSCIPPNGQSGVDSPELSKSCYDELQSFAIDIAIDCIQPRSIDPSVRKIIQDGGWRTAAKLAIIA